MGTARPTGVATAPPADQKVSESRTKPGAKRRVDRPKAEEQEIESEHEPTTPTKTPEERHRRSQGPGGTWELSDRGFEPSEVMQPGCFPLGPLPWAEPGRQKTLWRA